MVSSTPMPRGMRQRRPLLPGAGFSPQKIIPDESIGSMPPRPWSAIHGVGIMLVYPPPMASAMRLPRLDSSSES